MKFFKDTAKAEALIKEAIARWGYAPEHNFYWYQYAKKPSEENVFVRFPDGSGLLTVENPEKRTAYTFSLPLAPEERRTAVLLEYLEHALKKETAIDRVEIELETRARRALIRALPPRLRARAIIETMICPVMDMRSFDSSLPGGKFKSLRNARNAFYRRHSVEVADIGACSKEELMGIIDRWRTHRGARDRVQFDQYCNAIEHEFAGIFAARVMKVDGRAVGFNAGWPIPNSSRFYAAVGIHDYSIPDLGLMLYLEDLIWIKEKGFPEADMGGSGQKLYVFKKRFNPAFSYRTHYFSVVRNEIAAHKRTLISQRAQ